MCLALSLVLPSAAGAALPPAHPPDAAALRELGVRVQWPLTRSVTLSRLHELQVPVRSKRRVKVSLVVVSSRGRTLSTEYEQTLRNGTFVAWVAKYPGKRMALRLEVGRKRYWSWISVSVSDRTDHLRARR